MAMASATAAAHPNLALVKYWGQVDPVLHIPANSSISVNLSGATTTTSVTFDAQLPADEVVLNGQPAEAPAQRRVSTHLDRIRDLAGVQSCARVVSENDFPTAVGIASSASAFAALSLAGSRAAGLHLGKRELSVLARKGSGSAARSIPGGFVMWTAGQEDTGSYAYQIAPQDHWDLRIVTIAFRAQPKEVSSLEGHRAAPTSPFYEARLRTVGITLDVVRRALLQRDLSALGMAAEREAMSLHAVAMTSRPDKQPWMSGIYYMEPETLRVIRAVQQWRQEGLPVYFSLDAGPAVHLLCEPAHLDDVTTALGALFEPRELWVMVSRPGRGAWVVENNLDPAA